MPANHYSVTGKLLVIGVLTALNLSCAKETPNTAASPDANFTVEAENPSTTELLSKLDLARYKSTIKSLSQFGDRRQGTTRNQLAVNWIEEQLAAYGCSNIERITYDYSTTPRASPPRPTTAELNANLVTQTGGEAGRNGSGPGGSSIFGYRVATGVNRDLEAQPDERIRQLNAEEPTDCERQEVFCTKIGTTHPDEMYIIGAHMDGHGVNEAVNDNASGTALVMELARILSDPRVETQRSIRFAFWNNEETGLNGSKAYVEQRQAMQGIESPAGSGFYPEPRWLGMIQHDMMLWDHGAPRADGTVNPEQRPEADINIEFQSASDLVNESMTLAFAFKAAADAYNTDYPATVGTHTGGGWNPTWHTPLDVWSTFSDKDFRLGLNAAQTTLSAIAQLSGASVSE